MQDLPLGSPSCSSSRPETHETRCRKLSNAPDDVAYAVPISAPISPILMEILIPQGLGKAAAPRSTLNSWEIKQRYRDKRSPEVVCPARWGRSMAQRTTSAKAPPSTGNNAVQRSLRGGIGEVPRWSYPEQGPGPPPGQTLDDPLDGAWATPWTRAPGHPGTRPESHHPLTKVVTSQRAP